MIWVFNLRNITQVKYKSQVVGGSIIYIVFRVCYRLLKAYYYFRLNQ